MYNLIPRVGSKVSDWKKFAKTKRPIEISSYCKTKKIFSTKAEEWYEKGLIGKGEAIYDYYINFAKKVNSKIVKTDPEWDQDEYDSIFL